jgi:hypothetical protein
MAMSSTNNDAVMGRAHSVTKKGATNDTSTDHDHDDLSVASTASMFMSDSSDMSSESDSSSGVRFSMRGDSEDSKVSGFGTV